LTHRVTAIVSDVITAAYQNAGVIGSLDANKRWQLDEAAVKQLIAASVPDTVFNQIKGGPNAKAVWGEFRTLFEGHTHKIDHCRIGKKKYRVHMGRRMITYYVTHFDRLANLREQLRCDGRDDHRRGMLPIFR
jgi:hypothetical protein